MAFRTPIFAYALWLLCPFGLYDTVRLKLETVRIWASTGRLLSETYVALLLLVLGRRISFSLHA